ncbi:hypothetical protein BDZ45DRAFT_464813 [Acephala macrosclerotiorum]|nr:hypothetical protein BDZ45DRAFT_464813 [Acephala macrosclerotiorum]
MQSSFCRVESLSILPRVISIGWPWRQIARSKRHPKCLSGSVCARSTADLSPVAWHGFLIFRRNHCPLLAFGSLILCRMDSALEGIFLSRKEITGKEDGDSGIRPGKHWSSPNPHEPPCWPLWLPGSSGDGHLMGAVWKDNLDEVQQATWKDVAEDLDAKLNWKSREEYELASMALGPEECRT